MAASLVYAFSYGIISLLFLRILGDLFSYDMNKNKDHIASSFRGKGRKGNILTYVVIIIVVLLFVIPSCADIEFLKNTRGDGNISCNRFFFS